jgi:hypothetical protein
LTRCARRFPHRRIFRAASPLRRRRSSSSEFSSR